MQKLSHFKTKLNENAFSITKKSPESQEYVAKINCPHCGDKIKVFQKLSNSEFGSWNVFNFERHLSKHKSATANGNPSNKTDVKQVDLSHGLGSSALSMTKIEKNMGERNKELDKQDAEYKLEGIDETQIAETKDHVLIVVPPFVNLTEVVDQSSAGKDILIEGKTNPLLYS